MRVQLRKKEVKFSDYVGKGTYVLVDFWSPWCGPCRREVPNIKTVYDQYKDKGLEVLSLAVWEKKPQSHTIEVAGELGIRRFILLVYLVCFDGFLFYFFLH